MFSYVVVADGKVLPEAPELAAWIFSNAVVLTEPTSFVTVGHPEVRAVFIALEKGGENLRGVWLPKTTADFKINKIRQDCVALHGRIPGRLTFCPCRSTSGHGCLLWTYWLAKTLANFEMSNI